MIPKNHKTFKDGIAEEIGVHESVVDEFVSFYYKKVRDSLSNLEHTNVFIENLGTFSLRKARVEKAIINITFFVFRRREAHAASGRCVFGIVLLPFP